MRYDIENKVVLITGANRGIGKVFLETFIEHGAAKIYAAVRSLESVSTLVDCYGDKVVPIHLDLADPQSIEKAAQTAGDVQVVVNNAGVLTSSNPSR